MWIKLKNNKGEIIITKFDIIALSDISKDSSIEQPLYHIKVLKKRYILLSEPFESYQDCKIIMNNIYTVIRNNHNIIDLEQLKQELNQNKIEQDLEYYDK